LALLEHEGLPAELEAAARILLEEPEENKPCSGFSLCHLKPVGEFVGGVGRGLANFGTGMWELGRGAATFAGRLATLDREAWGQVVDAAKFVGRLHPLYVLSTGDVDAWLQTARFGRTVGEHFVDMAARCTTNYSAAGCGETVGEFLPDIALAVATGGASTAASAGIKGLRVSRGATKADSPTARSVALRQHFLAQMSTNARLAPAFYGTASGQGLLQHDAILIATRVRSHRYRFIRHVQVGVRRRGSTSIHWYELQRTAPGPRRPAEYLDIGTGYPLDSYRVVEIPLGSRQVTAAESMAQRMTHAPPSPYHAVGGRNCITDACRVVSAAELSPSSHVRLNGGFMQGWASRQSQAVVHPPHAELAVLLP
jgi:hypothetical protein